MIAIWLLVLLDMVLWPSLAILAYNIGIAVGKARSTEDAIDY